MSDFWDDHEQYDSEIESLRETLRDSVKEEIGNTIKELRAQNADMRGQLSHLHELETDAERMKSEAKWALNNAKTTAQREARAERLGALLRTLDERLYSLTHVGVSREKCDRCNDERRLTYSTPLGREVWEACTCTKKDYVWRAEETIAHAVELQRDGRMAAWWLPVKAWGDEDALGHRSLKPSASESVEVVAKDPRSWSFESFAAAERMADALNGMEKSDDNAF